MILTEDQSIQLACILIEASEENGVSETKEGLVSKIKGVLDRAIKWIKEKLQKLTSFIKEKFSKVSNFLLKPIKKLLKNSKFVKEFQRSYKEKNLNEVKDGPIKEYFNNLKGINNEIRSLVSIIKEVSKVANSGRKHNALEYSKEKLDEAVTELGELLEKYDEVSKNFNEYYRSESSNMVLTSIDSIKVAVDAIDEMIQRPEEIRKFLVDHHTTLRKLRAGIDNSNNENNYAYTSKLAYGLGKFSSGMVNFLTSAFSKAVSILKMLVSPLLKFFKKKKTEIKSTGGSSENLPAIA